MNENPVRSFCTDDRIMFLTKAYQLEWNQAACNDSNSNQWLKKKSSSSNIDSDLNETIDRGPF